MHVIRRRTGSGPQKNASLDGVVPPILGHGTVALEQVNPGQALRME